MCAFKSCQSVKKVSRSWLNLPALVHRWLSLFFRGRGAFSNRVSTLPCEKVLSHKIVYIFGSGLTVCVLLKAVKTWRKFQGVGQWHCIKFTCIIKEKTKWPSFFVRMSLSSTKSQMQPTDTTMSATMCKNSNKTITFRLFLFSVREQCVQPYIS